MSVASELLSDGFDRVRETVHEVVSGLDEDRLGFRPHDHGNSIGWLVWHLTRVQDDHVAEVAGRDQLWESDGWRERFDLPLPAAATGYGHSSSQVDKVRVKDASLLSGYYDAVHDATLGYVAGLSESDLDRVVDERWDPPVTLGVRLVSVIDDDIQHAGQAAFLRGMLLRRR